MKEFGVIQATHVFQLIRGVMGRMTVLMGQMNSVQVTAMNIMCSILIVNNLCV